MLKSKRVPTFPANGTGMSRLVLVIIIMALSVGFMGVSDTSAIDPNDPSKNDGVFNVTIENPARLASAERALQTNSFSKDAMPSLSFVELIDKGKMIASWYGPGFHGRLTANGETYDQMALTAAHKSLPFGTMLLVTNLKNGKSALVRINDRGPYIEGRDLDLSKGTALALGMMKRGVIEVNVKEVYLPFNSSPALTLN